MESSTYSNYKVMHIKVMHMRTATISAKSSSTGRPKGVFFGVPFNRFRAGNGWLFLCFAAFFAAGCSALAVAADPIFLPVLSGGDRFSIVEKENVRRRVDGRYDGYVYREYRGELHRSGASSAGELYEGTFYVLGDVTVLGSRAKHLDASVTSSVVITSHGAVETDSVEAIYPRTLSFPSIPEGRVDAGERWREFGTRIVQPRLSGRTTRIRFYCEYRYDGLESYNGEDVYAIRAQYALRYKEGDDPQGDPDLSSVSGSHIALILLSSDGSGRIFIRTTVDETYRFSDGKEITSKGFLLTWMQESIALDRSATVQALEKTLGERGTRDVTVEDRAEGVSIRLESIHFIPDSPEILPDERERLDALYKALSAVPDRTFLVVGHTANVGTAESQLALSVDRAKAVVAGLVARGIPADRFVYSGKGGSQPIAPNDSEEGRAKNRRVEVTILDG